ncbi:MAG: fibrobacter succinogenes major paralogous domain-containing protein [Bacteroidetes bacterium]|nr:fibrobacter succinogenes major paralogous domain-containing protein [Bacteroidota bacterium]
MKKAIPFLLGLIIALQILNSCKKSDHTTSNTSSGPTVTDIDGNVYHTVIIGSQTWMVENLKVTHYRNGDPIAPGTADAKTIADTTGMIYAYDNSAANVQVYGWLYNWYAVADGRNVAPIGWHVPTDGDYTTLVANLGGNYLLTNGDTLAGGAMKEAGVVHWGNLHYPNVGATNTSGWTGLPGGAKDQGSINDGLRNFGMWWTTTTLEGTNPLKWAYCMRLSCIDKSSKRGTWFKTSAYSIRCLSDKSQ